MPATWLSKAGWSASVSTGGANASNAIDGSLGTAAQVQATGTLTLNMGSAQTFDSVAFYFHTLPMFKTVEVYVSSDGSTWGSAVATLVVPIGIGVWNYFALGASYTRQYIRFKMLDSWSSGGSTVALPAYVTEVEVGTGGASVAMVTQAVEEILLSQPSNAMVTQAVSEILVTQPSNAIVTQAVVEILVAVPSPRGGSGSSGSGRSRGQIIS